MDAGVGSGGRDAAGMSARLSEVLEAEKGISFSYLFGSLAKGRARAVSDVDVDVFYAPSVSRNEHLSDALALEATLERVLGRRVEVVVLNDAPLELARNVLGHGVPAPARDAATRRAFFVETGRRYYDMARAREIFSRYRDRRIRAGTYGG